MTTIIVARDKKHIFLGADSLRKWTGSCYVTPTDKKIKTCHLGVFACAGLTPHWDESWEKIDDPSTLVNTIIHVHDETYCILVSKGEIYMGTKDTNGAAVDALGLDIFAMGSGGHLAHGFMMGSTLPLKKRMLKALEFAALYNSGTHGPFHIYTEKI